MSAVGPISTPDFFCGGVVSGVSRSRRQRITNLSAGESDSDDTELVLASKKLVLDHGGSDHFGGYVWYLVFTNLTKSFKV